MIDSSQNRNKLIKLHIPHKKAQKIKASSKDLGLNTENLYPDEKGIIEEANKQ